jgi:hypothetical protein
MTINDLIATSSVHAFNSGVESGKALEQERIVKLLEQVATKANKSNVFNFRKRDYVNRQKLAAICYHLAELIKGEQK